LPLLVGFRVIAFTAAQGDDSLKRRVFELAVGTFLTIQREARPAEVGDEFADLAGYGARVSGASRGDR